MQHFPVHQKAHVFCSVVPAAFRLLQTETKRLQERDIILFHRLVHADGITDIFLIKIPQQTISLRKTVIGVLLTSAAGHSAKKRITFQNPVPERTIPSCIKIKKSDSGLIIQLQHLWVILPKIPKIPVIGVCKIKALLLRKSPLFLPCLQKLQICLRPFFLQLYRFFITLHPFPAWHSERNGKKRAVFSAPFPLSACMQDNASEDGQNQRNTERRAQQLFSLLFPLPDGRKLPRIFQILFQLQTVLISVLRTKRSAFIENRLHPFTDSFTGLPKGMHTVQIRVVLRVCSGQQVNQRHSKCKNVGSLIALSGSVLLRSSIAFCSENDGVQTTFLLVFPGNSKINKSQLAVRSADHIGRLHVPVNNRRIPGVQILENITKLNADIRRFFLGKGAVFLQ